MYTKLIKCVLWYWMTWFAPIDVHDTVSQTERYTFLMQSAELFCSLRWYAELWNAPGVMNKWALFCCYMRWPPMIGEHPSRERRETATSLITTRTRRLFLFFHRLRARCQLYKIKSDLTEVRAIFLFSLSCSAHSVRSVALFFTVFYLENRQTVSDFAACGGGVCF